MKYLIIWLIVAGVVFAMIQVLMYGLLASVIAGIEWICLKWSELKSKNELPAPKSKRKK